MNVVTVSDAKHNFEQIIDRVIADTEPTIVVTDSGQQVVVLALDEYNSWKETLDLLASPANAARLRQSIAEAHQLLQETVPPLPSQHPPFPVLHIEQWPEDLPLRRAGLYDDRGR